MKKMADSVYGSTSLITKKKRDVNKCIICQVVNKKKNVTLTKTSDGIQKIKNASEALNDLLLHGLTENEIQNIKYHSTNCYVPYILKASRKKIKTENQNESSSHTQVSELNISSPRTRGITENVKTVCVICKCMKHKTVVNLYRIAEHTRATRFLAAFQFNKDDVYQRCIFLKTAGDIYAADLMYHSSCMSSYLLQFDRDLSRINEICDEMDPGTCNTWTLDDWTIFRKNMDVHNL